MTSIEPSGPGLRCPSCGGSSEVLATRKIEQGFTALVSHYIIDRENLSPEPRRAIAFSYRGGDTQFERFQL